MYLNADGCWRGGGGVKNHCKGADVVYGRPILSKSMLNAEHINYFFARKSKILKSKYFFQNMYPLEYRGGAIFSNPLEKIYTIFWSEWKLFSTLDAFSSWNLWHYLVKSIFWIVIKNFEKSCVEGI